MHALRIVCTFDFDFNFCLPRPKPLQINYRLLPPKDLLVISTWEESGWVHELLEDSWDPGSPDFISFYTQSTSKQAIREMRRWKEEGARKGRGRKGAAHAAQLSQPY